MRAVFIFALLVAQAALGMGEADAHLLAGATAFRAAQYEKALVEFKVAERLGAGDDTSWYVAATLVNLKRTEDALVAFVRARERAPTAVDALFEYYEAIACYDARLYYCAEELLSRVGKHAGPRIGAHVEKLKAQLAPLFATEPSAANVDWYVDRAKKALEQNQTALGRVYLKEALRVARRRSDCHRCAETRALVARVNGG